MKPAEENRMMFNWRTAAAALALAVCWPLAAFAQNAIQSITTTQQAGTDVVRIELAEPLSALPNGFVVQAPPRVAIDLPGVGNALGRNTVELNQGNVRSASIAQSGERTRLVLNLRQASSYRVQQQGKALIVLIDPAPTVAQAPGGGTTTQFAPSQNEQALAVRGLDFKRGAEGADDLARAHLAAPLHPVQPGTHRSGRGQDDGGARAHARLIRLQSCQEKRQIFVGERSETDADVVQLYAREGDHRARVADLAECPYGR